MSLQAIIALLRRHIIAVLAVFLVGAGVAYSFKHTPTTYQESATVVFTPPTSSQFPNPLLSLSNSLVDTAGVLAIEVTSPQAQQQIQAEGGLSSYQVQLYNLHNLEYPDFGDPYDIVTVTAQNATQVHRTYELVTALIFADLKTAQVAQGSPSVDWVAAYSVGDTGPLAQPGSPLRVYGGLLMLMIVAAFSLAIFLDHHRVTIPRRFRFRDGGAYSRLLGRPLP
jgi:hypothetical protein